MTFEARGPAREGSQGADADPAGPGGSRRGGEDGGARRGIRTVVLSALALAGLVALAVGALWSSLGPPAETTPGDGGAARMAGRDGPTAPPGPGGPAIAGTISVAPRLTGRVPQGGSLFIIARKGAGAGPPFAVKRILGPHFPLPYRLGPEDVLMAGSRFEGPLRLSAHLSASGRAGPPQPGDLLGEHAGEVRVGARGVDIVLARLR